MKVRNEDYDTLRTIIRELILHPIITIKVLWIEWKRTEEEWKRLDNEGEEE